MPSLFRFLSVLGVIGGVVVGCLYVLAVYFEPVPSEVTKPVPGVRVRTE